MACPADPADASLHGALACLRCPDTQVIETHLSWVLLCGDHAWKLKKPLRLPWLDHTTLAARERACREEVRLNRRLASSVYLGVVPLCRAAAGWRLGACDEAPAPGAPVVDWLVLMRRLPDDAMLDRRIAAGRVTPAEVDALLAVLLPFYRQARRASVAGATYVERLQAEQALNRQALERPGPSPLPAGPLLDRYEAALRRHAPMLAARAAQGGLVEGHGDLRPEHVGLLEPPVVIDCLEFDVRLREVDPCDELAFLALECRIAGAGWIGARLRQGYEQGSGDAPPASLWALYTARRALLRARLAWLHLFEPLPRRPERWAPLTRQHLHLCGEALDRLSR